MPANATAALYSLPGQKGKTDVLYVSDGQRYRVVRRAEIGKLNVGKSLSSVSLYAAPGAPGLGNDMTVSRFIVFGDQVWMNLFGTSIYYPNPHGFAGRFVQLTNRLDDTRWDANLGSFSPNLDNKATGVILVDGHRRGTASLPYSMHAIIAANQPAIVAQINSISDRVSYRSGPSVGWTAFVPKDKYLEPDRAYTSISIGLWIDLPDPMGKLKASVTYYLALWAGNGALHGWVKKYSWWREGVPLVGEWASALMRLAAELSWWKVNHEVLPPMLATLNAKLSGHLVDVYTLPGDQVASWFSGGWNSAFSGSSIDGVTAVFELKT